MHKNLFVFKDDFKRFVFCPKLMWIMRHRFEKKVTSWVKENLTFLDKDKEEMFYHQHRIGLDTPALTGLDIRAISGMKFEELIIQHFAKNQKIAFLNKLNQKLSPQEKTLKTQDIIASKNYQGYTQPYFCYQNYVTKCDLLLSNADNSYDLYEIKAVNNIEAKKRIEFFFDLAYQCWILKKLGLKVRKAYILHLNKNYLFQGKNLNIDKLFCLDSLEDKFSQTQIVNPDFDEILLATFVYLKKDFEEIKKDLLDHFCQENQNRKNPTEYCTFLVKKAKSKHNWLQLYRFFKTKKGEIYWKNQGYEINLTNPADLDILWKNTTNISPKTKYFWSRMIEVINNVDGSKIVKKLPIVCQELTKYIFPIYFYDFETAQFSIPVFSNSIPWLQMPFQYSIHILLSPDYNLQTGNKIIHLDFLVDNNEDPREKFLKKFCQDIQKYGSGTYVAYHKSFEKMILKDLLFYKKAAIQVNEKKILEKIINETRDLKNFFSNNFNIYHQKFYGSLSIKHVLPALVPELSYKHLKVKKGDQASALYFNYILSLSSKSIWEKTRKDLKLYCSMDTWAMVLIYKKIKKLVLAKKV